MNSTSKPRLRVAPSGWVCEARGTQAFGVNLFGAWLTWRALERDRCNRLTLVHRLPKPATPIPDFGLD